MPRVVPIDISQYVELRTMLDSVVAGSLRFYLDPLQFEKQKENYEFLKKLATVSGIGKRSPGLLILVLMVTSIAAAVVCLTSVYYLSPSPTSKV